MSKGSCKQVITAAIRMFLYLMVGSILSGCPRTLIMAPNPPNPKQGDIVQVRVGAKDKENLTQLTYNINEISSFGINVPYDVPIDTCKINGHYYTTLNLSGDATYNDGIVKHYSHQYDLLVGENNREDNDLDFAVYVGGGSHKARDLQLDMANKFRNVFDAYTESQYFWSADYFYTTDARHFSNSVDMAVSFGHGYYHLYQPRYGQLVDLSRTEYGNFAPCYNSGDLEYLVFAACRVLEMSESPTTNYWEYWFHKEETKFEKRPFTGLHMVIGFRTDFSVDAYHWGYWRTSKGKKFVKKFANHLDGGWEVVSAWLDAANDELSQRDGDNMAAVIYLTDYKHDTIYTEKNDYIYPHAIYLNKTITYLEPQ